MKTFERRMVSRGRVASALAALVSTGLFGLLTVINQTVVRGVPSDEPPVPITVAQPSPDAPLVEKPKVPEAPKESVVLPELPDSVSNDKPQPPVVRFVPPTLDVTRIGPFAANGVWIPEFTFETDDLDERPEAVRSVVPDYPPEKRMRRIDGWARVVFVVDELGRVRDAEIEATSDPAFGEAALNAIRNWRFNPGIKDGQAVRARMRQPFNFSADG